MLLPTPGDLDLATLADIYDWPDRPWLRGVMVMTLDGGFVGPDGVSGSISSPGDQTVFSAIRTYADAILVGAQTVRAEGYKALTARPGAQQARRAAGQAPAPTLVVVSARCRFDWTHALFPESDNPPIIVTTEASDARERSAAVEAGCEVVVAGERGVDLAGMLDMLRARGLPRVSTEGGPHLLGELVGLDLLDELDLTIAPIHAAGPCLRGDHPALLHELRLIHLLEQDGSLFSRYVRDRA